MEKEKNHSPSERSKKQESISAEKDSFKIN